MGKKKLKKTKLVACDGNAVRRRNETREIVNLYITFTGTYVTMEISVISDDKGSLFCVLKSVSLRRNHGEYTNIIASSYFWNQ